MSHSHLLQLLMNNFGTLYIVATPIGNLGDISSRAIDMLRSVDKLYTEDTRVTNGLLKNFDINTSSISFHAHSDSHKMDLILKDLIEGSNVALVTDAGTPGISDPGNALIDYLLSREPSLNIIPIPGASALTAALSVSGFNAREFTFLGFLPKKKLQAVYMRIIDSEIVIVYFDSPHRVIKNLETFYRDLGNRRLFVARELTKLHETHYRGSAEEVLNQLKSEKNLKGEIVVVIEGK